MTGTEILAQRGQQYGSFKQNVGNIYKIKQFIHIVGITPEGINDPFYKQLENHFDFVSNMLALKAARSLNTTICEASLRDCIVDFCNYANLSRQFTNEMVLFLSPSLFSREIVRPIYLENRIITDEEIAQVTSILVPNASQILEGVSY